ncbi:glucosaminidase domain-containing protein [Oceanibaculum indicum]|uniref:Mannosyl-glycoprotein endo-beta-N-acetylglucosamidase-like domain-containing protein n=1 Tax=Oceanibaculum indicum P24 TaxID=1207063 RepID=K2K673_9PROT|nr:glucosaminidase domain-containing protein [Oceanibaculum indicum]EKE78379.1 hypothetical protein P24_02421 [Oceanibaculum indicum P24]
MRKPDFATSSLGLLATAVVLLQATAILAGPTLPYYPVSGDRQAGPAATATALQAPRADAITAAVRVRQAAALPRVRLFTGASTAPLPGTVTSVRRSHEARQLFELAGYDLAAVRAGESAVPRLFLAQVPVDLRKLREVEERKTLFIKTVLPLILRVNEEIAEDRSRLLALDARLKAGAVPGPMERRWLDSLAAAYGVEAEDGALPNLAALLLRVDEIPVALALAQSIEESGWGTSRFAREGNALYGQYAWSDSAGLKPANAGADAAHVVRSFDRVIDAAAAYSLNLNTHPAYRDFRAARARMRAAGTPLDAEALAGHLLRYSERGADYVRTLRIIIRANRLEELQQASLASGMVVAMAEETPVRRGES